MISTWKRVFSQTRYWVLFVTALFVSSSSIVLVFQYKLFWIVMSSLEFSVWQKLNFFFGLFGIFFTSFSAFSAVVTLATLILFSVQVCLLVFYVQQRKIDRPKNRTGHSAGVVGMLVGALGVGCAACGTVILSAILGVTGAAGLLVLLPFHGAEFGVLGFIFLLYSVIHLTKRISDPLVCDV